MDKGINQGLKVAEVLYTQSKLIDNKSKFQQIRSKFILNLKLEIIMHITRRIKESLIKITKTTFDFRAIIS